MFTESQASIWTEIKKKKNLFLDVLFVVQRPDVLDSVWIHNRQLDVSFNLLRKIEGLERLTKLKKLFLLHNKITNIGNLEHLTGLHMLELGSNRIRVSGAFLPTRRDLFKFLL